MIIGLQNNWTGSHVEYLELYHATWMRARESRRQTKAKAGRVGNGRNYSAGGIWRFPGSLMTYACPPRKFSADTHLIKLQRLQNRVLRNTCDLDRCTPVRELHVAFKKIPFMHDRITILCRWDTYVVQYKNVRANGQREALHRTWWRSGLWKFKCLHHFLSCYERREITGRWWWGISEHLLTKTTPLSHLIEAEFQ
jgi:hypothetical protein